jgi:hypothetical protein
MWQDLYNDLDVGSVAFREVDEGATVELIASPEEISCD